jgi:hypothetical protein
LSAWVNTVYKTYTMADPLEDVIHDIRTFANDPNTPRPMQCIIARHSKEKNVRYEWTVGVDKIETGECRILDGTYYYVYITYPDETRKSIIFSRQRDAEDIYYTMIRPLA